MIFQIKKVSIYGGHCGPNQMKRLKIFFFTDFGTLKTIYQCSEIRASFFPYVIEVSDMNQKWNGIKEISSERLIAENADLFS